MRKRKFGSMPKISGCSTFVEIDLVDELLFVCRTTSTSLKLKKRTGIALKELTACFSVFFQWFCLLSAVIKISYDVARLE